MDTEREKETQISVGGEWSNKKYEVSDRNNSSCAKLLRQPTAGMLQKFASWRPAVHSFPFSGETCVSHHNWTSLHKSRAVLIKRTSRSVIRKTAGNGAERVRTKRILVTQLDISRLPGENDGTWRAYFHVNWECLSEFIWTELVFWIRSVKMPALYAIPSHGVMFSV